MTDRLTDRQKQYLELQMADLRSREEIVSGPTSIWELEIVYKDEVRPGRGHDITWFWGDGEYIAQGWMDVYGNGEYALASTDWIHNGADDQCECKPCVRIRQEEDN